MKTPSDDALQVCTIPGCGRAPEARQGNGLSPHLCRYHREHRSRHGSPLKKSYTGPELKPYVLAAESYIKAHKADFWIKTTLDHVAADLSSAGPKKHVNVLRWLDVRSKAKATLALLREKGVPPLRIAAVTLGVLATIAEDTYGPGGDRVLFRRVQIAKALRRRASGTHVVYEAGRRFSKYPRSAGKVLEALGAMMEDACQFIIHEHVPKILALKQERYGVAPIPPRGSFAKSKYGNEKVPPPPPAVPSPRQIREAEAREADRIAEEVQEAFKRDGWAAFRF